MSLGSDNANWSMERLVEIRELKGKVADLETEIHELLEENERLRKAGDELARVNDCRTGSAAFDIYIDEGKVEAIKAWLAAKGVQS